MKKLYTGVQSLLNQLADCSICPRECHVNRFEAAEGYCRSDSGYNIASICLHHGEEPVISGKNGICNVFFTHCNMQCIYCQNHQISKNKVAGEQTEITFEKVLEKIITILEKGCNKVGFVSPGHYALHVKVIIEELNKRGFRPVIVYNSNAYDSIYELKLMEGLVDIYLPDFKYSDSELAIKLSDTPDYPEIALKAIKEMYRQKGNVLHLDEKGEALSGLIIRHLVLPGYITNSINALKIISEEISPGVSFSLMSQYNPTESLAECPSINRRLTSEEYNSVIKEFEKAGFRKGWIQQLESAGFYNPDFRQNNPFE